MKPSHSKRSRHIENSNKTVKEKNTTIIQEHHPMNYRFLVKASVDVKRKLLKQFNIPITPIIFVD